MKIDFEYMTPYGTFRDAIWFPDDAPMTDDEITAEQQRRLDNWLFAVENPPAPEPETVEIDGVTYEKVEIDGQVVLKPVEV